jgi:hypothetical protein
LDDGYEEECGKLYQLVEEHYFILGAGLFKYVDDVV